MNANPASMTSMTSFHPIGKLAESAGWLIPIDVQKSAAGYYIGTFSPQEGPISRESVEYFATSISAHLALSLGSWTQRLHP